MRVALCLGSGGARGYAHIGVINEVLDRGHEIVGVSGSSMGSLVGGLQAAGKLDDYSDWASALTQGAVLRLLDPSLSSAGVLRAEKILDAVREILGDVLIEDLAIPFTSVSTDLIAGRSVWLQRGPVDSAIRASIAIPGLITPHVLEGRLLADGGILDPLPMAPLAAVNADLVIAVSLNGDDPCHTEFEPRPSNEFMARMWRSTTALLDTPAARSVLSRFLGSPDDDAVEGDDDHHAPSATSGDESVRVPKLGSFEVMNRSIDIAQSALMRHTLAAYPPDLLIEVPRRVCRSLDFHRAAEVIEIGQELAATALDTLVPQISHA